MSVSGRKPVENGMLIYDPAQGWTHAGHLLTLGGCVSCASACTYRILDARCRHGRWANA